MDNNIKSLNNTSTKNSSTAVNQTKPVDNNESTNKKIVHENKNDKYFNTKTIIGSLLGLAVLGSSIWGIKHYKKANNKVNMPAKLSKEKLNSDIADIKNKMTNLKKLIKNNFVKQRDFIISEARQKCENDNKIYFENLSDIRKQVNDLSKTNEASIKKLDDNIALNKKTIRDKLTKLTNNPEWKEIKLLRKKCLAILKSSKNVEQQKIAKEKIPMLNDLLYNRVYPESLERYKALYGMEDKQVLELVRKDFNTHEEFLNEFNKRKDTSIEFDYDIMEDRTSYNGVLTLKDVFPKEISAIETNIQMKQEAGTKINSLKELYDDILAKIANLANDYRNKPDVKELKYLLSQLLSKRNALQYAE